MNNIANNINSLSSPDPSLASTFYKNETIVEQQFTDCTVVDFFLRHSV